MDMITLAMAKAYTDSKQLASSEPGKVFTYDGSEDAEFDTINGIRVTVLSEDVFDLSKITKIECTLPNGQKVAFGKSDFVFSENGPFQIVTVSLGAQSAPVVFTGQHGGLLGYAQPGFGYCSYVEFAETIVPIDQKYLPGVCLPVVELSTAFAPFTSLTDAENKLLTDAHAKNVPVVIRCNVALGENGHYENTAVVWNPVFAVGVKLFIASFGGIMLQIQDVNNDGKWSCRVG